MLSPYVTNRERKLGRFTLWSVRRTGHPYAPDNFTWGLKWRSYWGKTYQWTKGRGFSSYGSWEDNLPFP